MQRIAVIGEATYHFNRRVVRGLAETLHRQGPFVMRFHSPDAAARPVARWLDRVAPTGVVAINRCPAGLGPHLRRRRLPAVSVNTTPLFAGAGRVSVDDRQIGQLAARFYLGRGARAFAFVSYAWATLHLERLHAFRHEIAAAGGSVNTYLTRAPAGALDGDRDPRPPPSLGRFLLSLPRPCSLLAGNDAIASVVLEQCQRLGIAVPRDVSILGIDDNPDVCLTSAPHLSTVGLPLLDMGRRAAEMLTRAAAGDRDALRDEIANVSDVIERETTEIYVPHDPLVERAIEHIHANSGRPLSMRTLRTLTGLSANQLAERFRHAIGRTPLMEVRRQRVEHARAMLRDTGDSIHDIAITCGFKSARYFSMVFRELTGMTPSSYRDGHQEKA